MIVVKARPPKATIGDPIAITHKNDSKLLNHNVRSINKDTIIIQRQKPITQHSITEQEDDN
jgi:hypothetical protein